MQLLICFLNMYFIRKPFKHVCSMKRKSKIKAISESECIFLSFLYLLGMAEIVHIQGNVR